MGKEITASAVTGDIEIPEDLHDFEAPDKAHEVFGVITGLAALVVLLSLISYGGLDSEQSPITEGNFIGVGGAWTAYFAFSTFGIASYFINAFIWFSAICLFIPRIGRLRLSSIIGMFFLGLFGSVILHTSLHGNTILGHPAGGFIGELSGELLISLVSTAGTYIIALGGILLVLLLITDLSLAMVAHTAGVAFVAGTKEVGRWSKRIIKAWRDENKEEEPEEEESDYDTKGENKDTLKKTKKNAKPQEDRKKDDSKEEEAKESAPAEPKIFKKKLKKEKNPEPETLAISARPVKGMFQKPSLSMLMEPPSDTEHSDVDEALLKQQADLLVKILSDFNVHGEVREIHPGPVVTMFEFQPRSGTKLSKIEGLASEIAMSLEVIRVRVVAPIPGKNAVGFELPNKTRETVYLKEMLIDNGFTNKKLKLPMALGKDIAGTPSFVDLAKMPHLLIAGTTGSGKSVSLNAMLVSLLYKYTPEDLRLLLIDPKMVELGIYDEIPHLLLPVVSDMSKACLALKWAVDEMERRYQLFADIGVRNLETYNKKIEKLKETHANKTEEEKKESLARTCYTVNEDEQVVAVASGADAPERLEKLPFIVIVVDELADLMMVAAKDVETSIARLAQKARAAGLHLIIATQRPSVDVVTGLIKANFPSRISFRVSSGTDSRTIIGRVGAENLLGMGDMLVLPPGTSDLKRVHGAFVDDDEINQIVDFLKAQGTPEYDAEILKPREDEEGSAAINEDEKDEVYDQAVAIVAEAQSCSISMLQRKLRIGYNRSARIVEIMEKEGVVGPANHQNKREVQISPL